MGEKKVEKIKKREEGDKVKEMKKGERKERGRERERRGRNVQKLILFFLARTRLSGN